MGAFRRRSGSHNETTSLGLTWTSTCGCAEMPKMDPAFATDDLDDLLAALR
jgi:hypothetical protein